MGDYYQYKAKQHSMMYDIKMEGGVGGNDDEEEENKNGEEQ